MKIINKRLLFCILLSWATVAAVFAMNPGEKIRSGDVVSEDWLSSPRSVLLEIRVDIKVEDVLSTQPLAEHNKKLGIPENTPPRLLFWSSDIMDHFGQQNVKCLKCEPAPDKEAVEPENGNRILFWDFSNEAALGRSFKIVRVYSLINHAILPRLNKDQKLNYDQENLEVLFYTKSEPFVKLTPEIREAAQKAKGDASSPLVQAGKIFQWVRNYMEYEYPPPGGRGATVALREKRGDCGQYADLFIALCRSAGIPARFAAGFTLPDPKTGKTRLGAHAWAEFMLPDGTWVPADPTREKEQYFARSLINTHITSSVGRNILLPKAPPWARYGFSDVEGGRTEFMQTLTELKSGLRAEVSITRRILPHPPEKGEP